MTGKIENLEHILNLLEEQVIQVYLEAFNLFKSIIDEMTINLN